MFFKNISIFFNVRYLCPCLLIGGLQWKLSAASPAVEDSSRRAQRDRDASAVIHAEEIKPASWQKIEQFPDVPISRTVCENMVIFLLHLLRQCYRYI